MTNLVKLDFNPLDIAGTNYMSWTMDIEIHLQSMSLSETIKEGNKPSEIDMAKSLIFIRCHLHEDLKNEYLTVKKPCELWKNLKERYDHQKAVMLPIYPMNGPLYGSKTLKKSVNTTLQCLEL
ncbi:unnamed protein product [Rhodiola kirilowii]